MGRRLSTTMHSFYRVKSETTSYMSTVIYGKKTHAYLISRMREVHARDDYRKLPHWARREIIGYEEGFTSAINTQLEWRHRRKENGVWVCTKDLYPINWDDYDTEHGAHFWKGTDQLYSGG